VKIVRVNFTYFLKMPATFVTSFGSHLM